MLYRILKLYARFAIRVYCRRIIINDKSILESGGPLLLAANHPNSFLDGMILTTLFNAPVYSLARGDAFKNKWINKLLRSIRLLPVYRTSEGVENLEHNYTTFASCQQTFEKKGIVLIFSEGRCENEWHLRPLKKGTARLSISSWKRGIPLTVIPTAFNYSSFHKFGKEVHIFFGKPIDASTVNSETGEGKQLLAFNKHLHHQLKDLVYEIDPTEKDKIRNIFSIKKNRSFFLLLLPAMIGWLIHAPLFYTCRTFSRFQFGKTGHYDSVLTSLLLLTYPFYWMLFAIAVSYFGWMYCILILLTLPLLAWSTVQVKYQLGW